jgi:hypothetical protein
LNHKRLNRFNLFLDRHLRIRRSRSMPGGVPRACLRSRFASSARRSPTVVVCVKGRSSGIRYSIRSRIGGSATGVLITDNCHGTVRRREQCAPGTRAAPEQLVNNQTGAHRSQLRASGLKHGRHRAAITGKARVAALTFHRVLPIGRGPRGDAGPRTLQIFRPDGFPLCLRRF